jgi:hypothetical protein
MPIRLGGRIPTVIGKHIIILTPEIRLYIADKSGFHSPVFIINFLLQFDSFFARIDKHYQRGR